MINVGINLMPDKESKATYPYPAVFDRRDLQAVFDSPRCLVDKHDYGLWVGREFYRTKKDYIKEAAKMGCCKKVPGIPDNVELGSSRIYLVHKEAGRGKKAIAFGYFILDGIVACTRLQEMIETAKESLSGQKTFSVTALTAQERAHIPPRGCGEIDPVSYYFVGPDDVTVQRGFRKSITNSKVRIVLIPEVTIDYLDRFRGLITAEHLFEFARV